MIRLATEDDLLWLAQQMVSLHKRSTWAAFDLPEFNVSTLTDFLLTKFDDPQSIIYRDGNAFCGGTLGRWIYPPYYSHISEWGWTGDPKPAARCLQAVFDWGKQHGAMFGGYVLARPGESTQYVQETWVWRKL